MSDIKYFNHKNEYGPRMSSATVHNGVVYTAGICGENGGDVARQTQDALDCLEQILLESGSAPDRLLSIQIWLANIDRDFVAMNRVYDNWLDEKVPKDRRPTRACVEAKIAAREYDVEIRYCIPML